MSTFVALPSNEQAHLGAIQRRATQSVIALTVRYGVVLLVNLATTIVLSRILGPHVWGIYAIAQFVIVSSQEILGRGVAAHLIRAEKPPSAAEIRSTFAFQNVLGMSLAALVLAASYPASLWYGYPELLPLLLAAGVACFAYGIRGVSVCLLERDLDYGKVAVVEISESLIFGAIAISSALSGQPILGLSLALLLRSILPTIVAWKMSPVAVALQWTLEHARTIAQFGFSFAALSVLNIVIAGVPPLIVGSIADAKVLGYTQLSFILYGNLLFASGAILRVAFSTYSRLADQPAAIQAAVKSNVSSLAAVHIALIVLFAGMSPLWVPSLFGARWTPVTTVLLAQAPAYLLAATFWGPVSSALMATGHHRSLLCLLSGFAVTYAGLVSVLTPLWAEVGVAIAWSLVHVLTYPILLKMYAKAHGTLPLRRLVLHLSIGSTSLGLIWLLASGRALSAIAIAVAFIFIWLVINRDTLRFFRDQLRSLSAQT